MYAAAASASLAAPASAASPLSLAVASYPTISFLALQRAEKTIADFVQSYLFVFHQPADNQTGGAAAAPSTANPAAAPPASPSVSASSAVPSAATLALMFRVLPLLTFVEATIYQLDEENEQHNAQNREQDERKEEEEESHEADGSAVSAKPSRPIPAAASSSSTAASHDSKRARLASDLRTSDSSASGIDHTATSPDNDDDDITCSSPSYAVLLSVLESQGLLTEGVWQELRKGRLYWQMERQICRKMGEIERWRRGAASAVTASTSASAAANSSPPPSLSLTDVHLASACKSFDYRVLHLLLFGLTGNPVDDSLLRALSFNERLVDLNDDLVDYEDDIAANSFNVYRAYVCMFGASAPQRIVQRIQSLEASYTEAMLAVPPHLAAAFRAREQRAMSEYGSSGALRQDGSTWTIPEPILDEHAWRESIRQAEQQSQQLEE